MATSYPGGIDAFTNPTSGDNLSTSVGGATHSAQHANLNDAVEAIEGELGVNPSGSYATVVARLDAGPTVDTVSLARTAGQSIASSTVTAVLWDSEVEDAGGFHSLVTNTDRVTVPSGKDGVYLVVFNGAFAVNGTGQRSAQINKNGSVVADALVTAQGVAFQSNTLTKVIRLVATDYLTFTVWQNSGGALNTDSTMFVSVARLGA